jgi:PAS domain S-box-containing protein
MKPSLTTFVPLPPASSSSQNPPAPLFFGSSNLQNKSTISAIDDMFEIFFEDGVFDDVNVLNPDMSLTFGDPSPPPKSSSKPPPTVATVSAAHDSGRGTRFPAPPSSHYTEDDDEYGDDLDDRDDFERGKNTKGDGDIDKNERRYVFQENSPTHSLFRERNREHAKRSRVRKKMVQESLQQSVNLLQEENEQLRLAISKHLGVDALPQTDNRLTAPSPSPSLTHSNGTMNSVPHSLSQSTSSSHYNLVKALQTAQQNFTITDPSLPDNPIIYASHGFLALTGYALDQVLGRNCRFLQGSRTDPRAVEVIRNGLRNGMDTTTVILNYRSDGTPFWNQLFIGPLKDSNGNVVNYLGVQCKVSEMYAEAFLKTPNASTISVANINTIYSAIMDPSAGSSSFFLPSGMTTSLSSGSGSDDHLLQFEATDPTLSTLPLSDDFMKSTSSYLDMFLNSPASHPVTDGIVSDPSTFPLPSSAPPLPSENQRPQNSAKRSHPDTT